MSEERRAKAKKIINRIAHSAATTTAAFSQVPGMGVATLTKLYLELADKLSSLFERKLESQEARSVILAGCNRHANALIKKSIIGWIPIFGNMVNAKITLDVTRKIGWFIYDYLERSETSEKARE